MNKHFEAGFNKQAEEFNKTAVAGAVFRAAVGGVKTMVKNPLKTLGVAFTANELAMGANAGAKAAARGANVGTFNVGKSASF